MNKFIAWIKIIRPLLNPAQTKAFDSKIATLRKEAPAAQKITLPRGKVPPTPTTRPVPPQRP